jgi:hypothetical protein
MDVKTILQTMAYQSISLDQITDSDVPVYLTYLNLAYYELLTAIGPKSPLLPKLRETLTCTDGIIDPPSKSIFLIRSVYDTIQNKTLKESNLDAIMQTDPGLTRKSTSPQVWYYDSGHINIYPLFTGTLGVLYISSPPQLSVASSSDDIYIPELYHSVLIDGALYYMFQSDSFKNDVKMLKAEDRWKQGKTRLASYLMSLSGQTYYSTYSPV